MPRRMRIMDDIKDRRILVTGGAGFIGSEVVRQLSRGGASITVLDNFSSGRFEYISGLGRITKIEGDVCDERMVSRSLRDHEIVIHLAALPFIPDSYYAPQDFFRVNTMGTVNLIWSTINSESVEKFVHVSSSEVYGTAIYTPMDENHPTFPHSTYAASKLAADRAVFTMSKEHDYPVVILRPFNSYGPNVTQPYIVPEIITQIVSGNSAVRLGNIDSSRDFTYVEDTARGIVLASLVKEAVGEIINLGSGSDIKVRDLALLMGNLIGRNVNVESDESRLRPYDVKRLVCDYSKARRILGWAPQVPLEEGLRRTIDWLSRNPVAFKTPFGGWPRYYRGVRNYVRK